MVAIPEGHGAVEGVEDKLDFFAAGRFEQASVLLIKFVNLDTARDFPSGSLTGGDPKALALGEGVGEFVLQLFRHAAAGINKGAACFIGPDAELVGSGGRGLWRARLIRSCRSCSPRSQVAFELADHICRLGFGQPAVRGIAMLLQEFNLLPGRWLVRPVHQALRILAGAAGVLERPGACGWSAGVMARRAGASWPTDVAA